MSAGVRKITLGTRGSELALAQATMVETELLRHSPELKIERKIIATAGDKTRAVDARAGWKGLFTAEIERSLVAGDVDLAVHSAKDLPSTIHPATQIGAALPRGSVEDILISKRPGGFNGLPKSATVATSSVRRKRQLLWKRPELSVVDLRGNVPTRLQKLARNDWDAIVLARAGLDRLGLSLDEFVAEALPIESFLPAGGQGIIAVQVRAEDENMRAIVDLVNDRDAMICLQAEREFLRLLNVDCNAPVGVLAQIDNGKIKMRTQFFEDGSAAPRESEVEAEYGDVKRLAKDLLTRVRP